MKTATEVAIEEQRRRTKEALTIVLAFRLAERWTDGSSIDMQGDIIRARRLLEEFDKEFNEKENK